MVNGTARLGHARLDDLLPVFVAQALSPILERPSLHTGLLAVLRDLQPSLEQCGICDLRHGHPRGNAGVAPIPLGCYHPDRIWHIVLSIGHSYHLHIPPPEKGYLSLSTVVGGSARAVREEIIRKDSHATHTGVQAQGLQLKYTNQSKLFLRRKPTMPEIKWIRTLILSLFLFLLVTACARAQPELHLETATFNFGAVENGDIVQ